VTEHELIRCATPAGAAVAAAEVIRDELSSRLAAAATASLAFSGGSSPGPMVDRLAGADLDWDRIDVFQVDERVAPDGDPARNLTGLRSRLTAEAVPDGRLHAIPVGLGADAAAADYAATLTTVLGDPAVLDVVHLGLGDDGHTASLVPGDAALGVTGADVAATADYRGHRRVTLTYPALDRAGVIVWLVTGADKRGPLTRLLEGDRSIPAGRVDGPRSIVCCDADAAPDRATPLTAGR
jgi:6-phosphogluconolactonase